MYRKFVDTQGQIEDATLFLLHRFIEEKLNAYVEPVRAGTPKGELIGFMRPKYHAALLFLTTMRISLNLTGLAR